MTSQSERTSFRAHKVITTFGLASVLCVAGLTGCSSEEEEKPAETAAVQQAPTPPPPPKTKTVADLMAEMGIDERIMWPEEHAPKSTEDRRAILTFFDAFARGDSDSVSNMLPRTDRFELEALVESGQWDESAENIFTIDLRAGSDTLGEPVIMAQIWMEDDSIQPQLWHYHVIGSDVRFEAEATPPNIMEKISGVDPIESWYAELEREMALANQPDEFFEIPQRKAFDESDSSSQSQPAAAPGGPFGPGPMTPTKPSGPKRRPPRGPFSK